MPRPNQPRSIRSQRSLPRRVALEREAKGWTPAELAERMTAAGCPINTSAIYKIEKGDPPRTITAEELIAMGVVFETSLDVLTMPIELVEQQRARKIASNLPRAFIAYEDAVMAGIALYAEYFDVAAREPELKEYIDNHSEREWNVALHARLTHGGVELGDGVTDVEVRQFQQAVGILWDDLVQLAAKGAGLQPKWLLFQAPDAGSEDS